MGCRVEGWVAGEGVLADAGGEAEEVHDDAGEAVGIEGALYPGAVGLLHDGVDEGEEAVGDGVDGSGQEGHEAALGCWGGGGHGLLGSYSTRWVKCIFL